MGQDPLQPPAAKQALVLGADGVDEDPLVPDANEDDAEEAALHGKVPEGWDVLGKVEEEDGYELVGGCRHNEQAESCVSNKRWQGAPRRSARRTH